MCAQYETEPEWSLLFLLKLPLGMVWLGVKHQRNPKESSAHATGWMLAECCRVLWLAPLFPRVCSVCLGELREDSRTEAPANKHTLNHALTHTSKLSNQPLITFVKQKLVGLSLHLQLLFFGMDIMDHDPYHMHSAPYIYSLEIFLECSPQA